MKKLLIVSVLLAGIAQFAQAQYYYYNENYLDKDVITEIGASIGGMGCFTDLGGKKDALKNIKFSSGFYIGALYRDIVGIRFEATWGKLSAADSLNSGKSAKLRNLSFKSDIQEVALIAEFHPLMLFNRPDGPPLLSPYILAGLGWFSFNPKTNLNGREIYLQPLRTEGQGMAEYPTRKPYKLSQANVPLGGGIKYELSPLFVVRGEFLYRILFTDYLDDVSTTYINPSLFDNYLSPENAFAAKALYNRGSEKVPGYIPANGSIRGNPKKKDGYFTFNFKIGITLGRTHR